jgi:hypothetical protein
MSFGDEGFGEKDTREKGGERDEGDREGTLDAAGEVGTSLCHGKQRTHARGTMYEREPVKVDVPSAQSQLHRDEGTSRHTDGCGRDNVGTDAHDVVGLDGGAADARRADLGLLDVRTANAERARGTHQVERSDSSGGAICDAVLRKSRTRQIYRDTRAHPEATDDKGGEVGREELEEDSGEGKGVHGDEGPFAAEAVLKRVAKEGAEDGADEGDGEEEVLVASG